MGDHNQLSLHSCVMHMFVNCKVNLYSSRHTAFSFYYYLSGHVFKILTINNFRVQYLYTEWLLGYGISYI